MTAFCFSLECYDPTDSREMLRALVAQVLASVGCSSDIDRTIAGIEEAAFDRHPGQRFGLQFLARDGELSIVVSSGASAVWQTSCPIP